MRPHTGRSTTAMWVAVAALCLIQFIDVMSVTVVITALPDMLAGVGAPPAGGTLVAAGYATFFGGLLMFGARLGDWVGHRRCIIASLVVFACGGLLAATATSRVALTAARCIQGAAAAAAVPSATTRRWPWRRRPASSRLRSPDSRGGRGWPRRAEGPACHTR